MRILSVFFMMIFFIPHGFTKEPGVQQPVTAKTSPTSVKAEANSPLKTDQGDDQSPPRPRRAMRIQTRIVGKAKTDSIFDQKMVDLKKDLKDEKDPRKRYEILARATDQLAAVKAGPRPDDEQKALEMALVLETFSDLPPLSKFKSGQCASIYKSARLKMENRVSGEPEDPGVMKGLEVLRLVCGI